MVDAQLNSHSVESVATIVFIQQILIESNSARQREQKDTVPDLKQSHDKLLRQTWK